MTEYICNLSFTGLVVTPHGSGNLTTNTSYPTNLTFVWNYGNGTNQSVCSHHYHYGEYGHYRMMLGKICKLSTLTEPVNSNIREFCLKLLIRKKGDEKRAILVAFCVYAALGCLWLVGSYFYRKKFSEDNDEMRHLLINTGRHNNPDTKKSESASKPRRLKSLDTFRGMCLCIMAFVNYGGGGYWFFDHSVWNGITVADLVFPWFMWIMGTSTALSFRGLQRKATPKVTIFLKVVRRTITLFLLGLFIVNSPDDWYKIRIPGVLQRFAVSYFAVSTMMLLHIKVGEPEDTTAPIDFQSRVRDLLPYWKQWLFVVCLLVVHTCLTFLMPVPGCPTGYLGAAGLSDLDHSNCTGGAALQVDNWLLTQDHIYDDETPKHEYQIRVNYDPEGVLGSLTSIFMTFLGLQAGKILLAYKDHGSRLVRWVIWGVVLGLLAILLCQGRQNGGWIPINKNLWSLTFVLSLASMAFLLLSLYYFLVDVRRWWTGFPFFMAGMNSISVYLCHGVFQKYLPFSWKIQHRNHGNLLFMNLFGSNLWTIVFASYLYWNNIFINI
ncbi:PREDICTED: heparan-alpha-glucosaminide N-acetyltransferase-like [Branchiostoma belcheri]|uniref:Heparan-alpha-glucosaminide N-acetyltransferase-like n=1 Tax=Branchiostoma belcheri TaxID=7741 RepID=A0A6P4ZIN9_BRABE|nr:PREDICTED: heparan-alpha-glucosaminide N-acetyltransferase-like [Branchiostoma belcheri]